MNMGTATPSSSKTLTTAEMAGIAGVVLAALALVTLVIVLLRCRQWRRRDESLWSILLSEKRKHVKVAIPFWENSHPRRHGIDSFSNDRFSTSNSSSGLADGQPAMAQPDKAHGKPSSAPAISPLGLHVAAAASASSFLRLFTNSSARSQASNEKV
ncbi:hypothetical protein QQS21_007911 [Conoideocrella luteorostrata]|uniref:Uncharacterized protein n=1 Tax=Conoideocrella luteorostrata TaxID=1105319 RepID=A0AAJ0FZ42_9HYPO|nr:hypothetical protein QQS21_007911 [Conoideocrella luteorostrata]